AVGANAYIEKLLMQLADGSVRFHELREGLHEHRLSLILIEFLRDDRLRKVHSRDPILLDDDFGGIPLAHTRARTCAIKGNFMPCPIFSQVASLRFTEGRELVVIRLEKGCLRVAYQENTAHRMIAGYAVALCSRLKSAKSFPCSANCLSSGAGCQSSPCC